MKKVLILVLSSDFSPYDKLLQTGQETWDSVSVEGMETVYYCAQSEKKDTDKIIYLPIEPSLRSVTRKTVMAFEWALENKEFDYIARIHASIYCDKKQLADYVKSLPARNVFAGLKVDDTPVWVWGGCGFILSKDVIRKLVDIKDKWDYSQMEDRAMSYAVSDLKIPYRQGNGCSIDKYGESWLCLSYGPRSKSFTFTDFADVPTQSKQFFYRCKQDGNREMDLFIMKELFRVLK